MSTNYGYLKSTAGRLKLISIVLLTVVVLLSTISHFKSEYTSNRQAYAQFFTKNELRSLWREYYLIGASILVLACSVLDLLAHTCSMKTYWNKKTAIISFFFHAISAILLATSGVLMIVSAVKIYDINCTPKNGCQEFVLKLGAGFLSMITSLIIGSAGVVVLTNRKDVEREMLLGSDAINKP